MPIDVKDIPFEENPFQITRRRFEQTGEQRYRLELSPAGIVFEVDRLRRERHELTGELTVKVNGHFPGAKKYEDALVVGDLNFSSVQARSTRAKLLESRSGAKEVDWYGCLEEFTSKVISAERVGKPAVILADQEPADEANETWAVEDFPILRSLPMIVFGDSGSAKSYFSLWAASVLAGMGVNVLYADWELAANEHRKRLGRLAQPMPRNIHYARCDRSLRHETERILKLIQLHGIQYVICDSIGFAVDGPAESHEAASEYFRAIRQLGIGTMSIAHIPKQQDDSREAHIFGSTYFRAGARSVWFIEAAKENPKGELRVGLYQRKNNIGSLLAPKGFKFTFDSARTIVQPVPVGSVDELAAALPLLDRLKRQLQHGPKPLKDLAETLGVSHDAVRKAVGRHESVFLKVGKGIGLKYEHSPLGRSEEF